MLSTYFHDNELLYCNNNALSIYLELKATNSDTVLMIFMGLSTGF